MNLEGRKRDTRRRRWRRGDKLCLQGQSLCRCLLEKREYAVFVYRRRRRRRKRRKGRRRIKEHEGDPKHKQQ